MNSLPKVVITDFIDEPLTFERQVLDGHAEVSALNASSEDELAGQIEDADAIMVYHYFQLSGETIRRLKNCKVIVRPGVGYDGVDIETARECGIPVCNVPDYGTEEIADSAIALMMSLVRGTHFLNSRLRQGKGDWNVDEAKPLQRMRGRVFGMVGCGQIATAAAMRAKAFGLEVAFYDPGVPDGVDKALGIRRVDSLDELLAEAFVLSLHCPLNKATKGMIDANAISKMTPGSYIVNTARGGVMNTVDAVDALVSGQLAGVGLDVLEEEPPAPDSPVIAAWQDPEHPAHDRLILTPHSGFYCEEGEEEFRTKGALEVLRGLRGEALRNQVN